MGTLDWAYEEGLQEFVSLAKNRIPRTSGTRKDPFATKEVEDLLEIQKDRPRSKIGRKVSEMLTQEGKEVKPAEGKGIKDFTINTAYAYEKAFEQMHEKKLLTLENQMDQRRTAETVESAAYVASAPRKREEEQKMADDLKFIRSVYERAPEELRQEIKDEYLKPRVLRLIEQANEINKKRRWMRREALTLEEYEEIGSEDWQKLALEKEKKYKTLSEQPLSKEEEIQNMFYDYGEKLEEEEKERRDRVVKRYSKHCKKITNKLKRLEERIAREELEEAFMKDVEELDAEVEKLRLDFMMKAGTDQTGDVVEEETEERREGDKIGEGGEKNDPLKSEPHPSTEGSQKEERRSGTPAIVETGRSEGHEESKKSHADDMEVMERFCREFAAQGGMDKLDKKYFN